MTIKSASGREFEDLIELVIDRSCRRNQLEKKAQSHVGQKPGGGKHIIDWELWERHDPSRRALLSCKIQTTTGTAEEKVPYEVLKCLHTMDNDSRFRCAWIVLGGNGWNRGLLNFYLNELPQRIPQMAGRVTILRTDALISRNLAIP